MARRRKGRIVNGIIVLDKPSGLTSNAALQKVKRAFFAQKAGHTGALDPLATGVLPLCLGEGTKFSQYLLDADKSYDCTIMLGQITNTLDTEGDVVVESDASSISMADVAAAIKPFLGDIKQIPPMFSALKRNGKPLYELARAGIEIERDARPVHIYELVVKNFRPGIKAEIDISVTCSKGTYIRVLAQDIGHILGVGGCVKVLRRTKSGPFGLEQMISLDEIESLGEAGEFEALNEKLLPIDIPILHLPIVDLDADSSFYIKRGNPVQVPKAPLNGLVRLMVDSKEFIGVGEILDDGRVAPRRLVQA